MGKDEAGGAKVHQVKCWPSWFDALINDEKGFEIRYDDRGYEVGDSLVMREWDDSTKEYTGRIALFKIQTVWGDLPGLKDGYVGMDIVRG